MSSTLNKENGATAVIQIESSNKMDGTMKKYRVMLRSKVVVAIDVEAEDELKARGKAYEWYDTAGSTKIGYFGWTDAERKERLGHDDSYLDWEIVDLVELQEILRVAKLDDVAEDT